MDDNPHFTKCYHPMSTASFAEAHLPFPSHRGLPRVTLTLLALPQIGQTSAPMGDSHTLTTCGSYARCHGEAAQTQTILITISCPGPCEIRNLQAQYFTKDLSRRDCSWVRAAELAKQAQSSKVAKITKVPHRCPGVQSVYGRA